MAIDFPDAPNVNDEYTVGSRTWKWNGTVWETVPAAPQDAVTLTGTPDYLTLSGQQITRNQIDLTADVTGDLPLANLAQASATARILGRNTAGAGDWEEVTEAQFKALFNLETGTDVQAHSAVLDATTASFTTADETKLDGIEAGADVTDTANVTAAGALMDSEVDADIKTLVLPANTTITASAASELGAMADPQTVADTTDTLAAADKRRLTMYSNAAQVTVTVPTGQTAGDWYLLQSTGAGGVTLTTTGLTLNGSTPNTTIAQNESMLIVYTATSTISIIGATAA